MDTEAKRDMRRRITAARRTVSEEQVAKAGSAIRDALTALPSLTMGGTVAAYYSVGTEPDTRKLITTLWKQGTYVLLPIYQPNGDLDWAGYDGPDSLVRTDQGLLEPTGHRYGLDAVRRCAAVVCPALAVDQQGGAARPRCRLLRPDTGQDRAEHAHGRGDLRHRTRSRCSRGIPRPPRTGSGHTRAGRPLVLIPPRRRAAEGTVSRYLALPLLAAPPETAHGADPRCRGYASRARTI